MGLRQEQLSRADELATVADTEGARLCALDRYDVLDTPREEAFDRISRLAKKLFDVPIAIVSFIDAHRQWYKAAEGLTASEVPLPATFCRHVLSGESLVVPDTTVDPRFQAHPDVVGGLGVRAYFGVPLRTADNFTIGSLCVIDTKPRDFDPDQAALMADLAGVVMDELELRRLATRDSLTGVMSRLAFTEEAGRQVALALRHHQPVSCLAIDLDHFKAINDGFGHAGGDAVLKRSVIACTDDLRETDLIGRLGGEEFAVLLPETGSAGAMKVAEKLRDAIAAAAITLHGKVVRVTASIGVASLGGAIRNLDSLLQAADAACYAAKAAGRNRCVADASEAGSALSARRRVLKAGQIIFNGRTSSMDCTVRGLSEDGAELDVSSAVGIPKRFDLSIKADRFEKPCRITRQWEKRIEVAFC